MQNIFRGSWVTTTTVTHQCISSANETKSGFPDAAGSHSYYISTKISTGVTLPDRLIEMYKVVRSFRLMLNGPTKSYFDSEPSTTQSRYMLFSNFAALTDRLIFYACFQSRCLPTASLIETSWITMLSTRTTRLNQTSYFAQSLLIWRHVAALVRFFVHSQYHQSNLPLKSFRSKPFYTVMKSFSCWNIG